MRACEVLVILLHSPLFGPHRVTRFRELRQKEHLIPLQSSTGNVTSHFICSSFLKSPHEVPNIITRHPPTVLSSERRLWRIFCSGLRNRRFNLSETLQWSCAATVYIELSQFDVTVRDTGVFLSSRIAERPSSSSVASRCFLNRARCSRKQSCQKNKRDAIAHCTAN